MPFDFVFYTFIPTIPAMALRAIIFDFDGLILDTESPALQCWQELYAAFECPFPLDDWYASLGCAVRTFDPYGHLVSFAAPRLTMEELRTRRRAREHELVGGAGLRPGIGAYLAAAQGMGLKLAVASSSHHPWVDGHLKRMGVHEFFSAIICAEDSPRHKPDPAPFQLALQAIGVEAEEAIALEDSPNGIAAAQGAGIFTVAVPNDVTRHLDLSAADVVADPLTAFSLQDVAACFERKSPGRRDRTN